MGQGFSLTTPSAGAAGIDVPELSDLVYEKSIGTARFLKSIRARHRDGVVLVKVLVKPHPMSLSSYREQIVAERKPLSEIPNALPYSRVIETETNGYLVRQFLYNSLYDRLSTRPFLEDIEKKWLAFQLLCAVRDCHSRDIYHGDIKAENTLVTSWNWLYLSDFSSYKPVTLPEDNPADFSYFFDTSGRRTCYLAPERFVPAGASDEPDAKVTWAMDVFSAGCVIAELFLESPIFSLSQIFKYRVGQYDPVMAHLSRIPDREVREMITHMIQLDPQKRYSAEHCLDFWRRKVFPDYFYSFLHQYMEIITHPASGRYASTGSTRNMGEADERIDRVFYDFDKISYFLGYKDDDAPHALPEASARLGLNQFPVRINIPDNEHYTSSQIQLRGDDGTLIFLTLVVSSLRNTARAASKLRACDVLLAFAERLTDDAKLDRVLPYLMALLNDKADVVVVAALRTITQLLRLVRVVSPVNSHVFLEYIFPRMHAALFGSPTTPSPIVRAVYASCLGSLAQAAARFLDLAVSLRPDGSLAAADPEIELGNNAEAAFDDRFDDAKQELEALVEAHTKALIEDSDPFVRRAFLSSVPELCTFFGTVNANDVILTHLNTYLNDRDWMLKCAFFDGIVGIAAFLGSASLEDFILPLMVQALKDPEEFVVQSALHSLAELARLGLFSKPTTAELVDAVARFTMHPNIWVRESSAEFLASAAAFLSPAELRCTILPSLKPYLKSDVVTEFSELALLDALKRPLPRSVFDQSLIWASKTDRGIFWNSIKKQSALTFLPSLSGAGARSSHGTPHALSRVPRNDEDEQWLSKLRNLGLSQEDEVKLLALREFIWRLSQMKPRESSPSGRLGEVDLNNIIPLRTLGIRVQTIMFEEPSQQLQDDAKPELGAPRTITDALLDASMTIDDPVGRRRRAALNSHRTRLNSRGNLSPSPADVHRQRSPDARLDSDASTDQQGPSSVRRGKTLAADEDAEEGGSGRQKASSAERRVVRHQSSAMSLLNRKDSAKSGPETGTTEANAFGRMGGPFTAAAQPAWSPTADAEMEDRMAAVRVRVSHTYVGNDPDIMKMLDSMYTENYPHDLAEFGPLVSPVSRRKASRAGGQPVEEAWKPSGKLVATFSEHTGAINRIVVSPDHIFFVTGGDDGSVRVWDTARLEKNITQRSRQTHRHAAGAKVLALCFIESTHCFVSCATDGSVHVVKAEVVTAGGSTRYGKPRLLREYQLPPDEFAVWCEHFKQESQSVLVLATNRSRVLGIDLRTMAQLFVLENPVHHGTPTCFCTDRKRNWLCLATSHGVLDLWDLRFKLRIKCWGVPGKQAIYRLCIHPTKGRGKWVCAAGGTGQGEVTVWDVEKALCREVYRVGGNRDSPKGYEAWQVDEENRPEGMLARFATSIEQPSTTTGTTATSSADRGVRAMLASTGGGPADDHQHSYQRDVRHAFMLTGGSDRKLRFWDLARIENSVVFSGLLPEEGRPTYTASQVTTSMTLNTERLARQSQAQAGSSSAGGAAAGGGGGGTTKGRSTAKTPRSTVISLQQQQLLKSHLDAVMDVAIIEVPYTMTVSADRSGVIFVFQ